MNRGARKSSSGFTLLELLVVIAVIGVLAVLLMPVVAQMRESSRGVQCLNRMRQLGAAMMTCAAENRQRIPIYGEGYNNGSLVSQAYYVDSLIDGGYVGDALILTCPSFPVNAGYYERYTNRFSKNYGISHGFEGNEYVTVNSDANRVDYVMLLNVEKPSQRVLLADSVYPVNAHQPATVPKQQALGIYPNPKVSAAPGIHARHNRSANVLYCDGRAAPVTPGNMQDKQFLAMWDKDAKETLPLQ